MSLVDVSVNAGIAVLELNDPERRNIISLSLVSELEDAFDSLERDLSVNVVVITGRGPAFCAGADLSDLEAASRGDTEGLKRIYRGFLRIAESPLVSIAAVNGPAVGAGFNLALSCDLRVAGENARFDARFMKLALHPGGGHTWMLQRAIGWQSSVGVMLLSQVLSGEDAKRIGLVWECFPHDQLISGTRELAAVAAGTPRELLQRTKRSLSQSYDIAGHTEAVDREYEDQVWSLHQPEFIDFLERVRTNVVGGGKK